MKVAIHWDIHQILSAGGTKVSNFSKLPNLRTESKFQVSLFNF